ncbi:hypothetical protein ACXVUH_10170 [Ligilactobacillus salivarius]
MNKKKLARRFLEDNLDIDLNYLDEIKKQPINKIEFMGGVKGWYLSTKSDYKLIKNAIEFAQYKNKTSDRNWITVNNLWREVVNEKLILGGF